MKALQSSPLFHRVYVYVCARNNACISKLYNIKFLLTLDFEITNSNQIWKCKKKDVLASHKKIQFASWTYESMSTIYDFIFVIKSKHLGSLQSSDDCGDVSCLRDYAVEFIPQTQRGI